MGLAREPNASRLCVCGKEALSKGAAKSLAKRQQKRTGVLFDAYACYVKGGEGWHVGKPARRRARA